ncbi:hypothetical protein [Kitasatospora sp. NPDC094015]|uniref:hypothetical protein n=1 Tax=Kitasatospora sp. NPDC094015 TaxID=3155205 RepID=UPI003318C6F8
MPQQREQSAPPAGAVADAEADSGAAAKPTEGRGRLDLSMAQVAASALATVVGAVLASELGVYGTIIGAAVVSVGATVGSALFQHLFRRTGEQLRTAVDRGPGATANGLRQVQVPVPAPGPVPVARSAGPAGEWNEPQLLRARRRWTWRTGAAVSALVFALAMVPILAVEVLAGQPVSSLTGGDQRTGTSFNPGRGGPAHTPSPPKGSAGASDPAAVPSGAPGGSPGSSGAPSASPSGSAPATPSGSPSAGPTGSPSAGASASPSTGPSGPSGTPSAGTSGAATTPGGPATPTG